MDPKTIRVQLGEYLERVEEYIAVRADPNPAADLKTNERLLRDWLIRNQGVVGNLLVRLVPGARFRQFGGAYWPASIPAEQRDLVRTALGNIEGMPHLADQFLDPIEPEDPWAATADELEAIADSLPQDGWTGFALQAAQLVRRVDSKAADQIHDIIEKHDILGPHDYPSARENAHGIIRGAATAARRFGTMEASPAPQTVVSVSQSQSAAASAAASAQAVAMSRLEDVLTWRDLPNELRPDLEALREAASKGDKKRTLEEASNVAGQLANFPALVVKLGDFWELIQGLLS